MSDRAAGRPPIEVEQWLDFVIAAAAHRSHDDAQRRFGEALIQRYFVSLPERYREDRTATLYFDNMLCAVASAIRGFSIVRDVFQTNWDSIRTAQEDSQRHLQWLEAFAPLQKGGHWGKALAAVIGLGLGAPLVLALRAQFAAWSPLALLTLAALMVISLFGVEVLVDHLRSRQARRFRQQIPDDVLAYWEERALKGYRTVLKQFLPMALEITGRYYPEAATAAGKAPTDLDEMVETHFAFGPRVSTPSVSGKSPA